MQDNLNLEKLPNFPISGPSAWYSNQMEDNKNWIYYLSKSEIQEIKQAILDTKDLQIIQLNASNFVLPRLKIKLKKILNDLISGRGFVLLKGLPIKDLSMEDVARAYWGIGQYIGSARSQNANGDLLGHVIDLSKSVDDPNVRIYQTSARQNFHCDSTDIVGLLCLQKAMSGGASSILSSVTLFNEILKNKPEYLEELSSPFYIDRRGETPKGKKPWYKLPVFCWYDNQLTTHFTRPYIESAQRFNDVPKLTNKQIGALNFFQELCERKDIQLNMDFEPGDIQLLNNYQILHDRKEFKDWPSGKDKRHLLRLWLCTEESRKLHPIYLNRQDSIKIGNRGGILVAGTKMNVNFEIT